MYEIDGDFGRVRHIRIPFGHMQYRVPFITKSGGWHCCNEKYHYQRDGSQQNHLLLFSVSEGGMIKIEGEHEVKLPAGSVAWLPPGKAHHYGTITGQLWEFYWIHIEDTENLQFEKIFHKNFVIQLSNMDFICKEFENMIHNRYENIQEYLIEGYRMISDIYYTLMKESVIQIKKEIKMDEMIHRIIQDMEKTCESEWNLSELAKQYFISTPQLIRRFKKHTGLTPHAYLITVRLKSAEMYLIYTNMTIEEISKKVGFSNTSNFIYQFQKETGMTPKKYRSVSQNF